MAPSHYLPEPLQSAEIIRTELTRRCPIEPLCPLMPADAPDPPLALPDPPLVDPPLLALPEPPLVDPPLLALPVVPVLPLPLLVDPLPPLMLSEVVPVISTRWPTCFFRSDSLPSSM